MSKEAAMQLATGQPNPTVNPSVVAGDIPQGDQPPAPASLDSERFAKFAMKEKALQKEREAFKSEQQKLYEEKRLIEEIKTKAEKFEALKAANKFEALKYLGIELDETDLVNYMAEKPDLTPEQRAALAAEQAADNKIKTWEQQQAEKAQQEAKERDERAITAFKIGIREAVKKDSEKYEYCNHYGAIADEIIYETVLEIVRDDKEIAPHQAMKEAMELVENFYEEQDKEMSKLKKRQPKVEIPAKEEPLKAQVNPRKPIPSLSNKQTPTVASVKTGKEDPQAKRARLENWLRTGVKN